MSKRTGNPNGPISPWKHKVQEERRKSADERQSLYNKLTPEQKIAKLDSNGWTATKERTKILNSKKGK